MANLDRPIKNIVVLGASGNIGRPIIDSLLVHPAGYAVTAVTRSAANVSFPANVNVVESDFSDESLTRIFSNQDAIIASVPVPQVAEQRRYIDLAIACNVARFVPSEFGMDTFHPDAVKFRPGLVGKVKIIDYLKSREDKITWTAFITGGFFDWALLTPGGLGWNIPERKVTIYDGGDVEWETTNLNRIGEAVAASLSPRYRAIAANQVAYINSFTISQNQILAALEGLLGEKLKVTEDTKVAYRDRAAKRLLENPGDKVAALDMATASILGFGGINQYSKDHELWNQKLGLSEESLQATLERVLQQF